MAKIQYSTQIIEVLDIYRQYSINELELVSECSVSATMDKLSGVIEGIENDLITKGEVLEIISAIKNLRKERTLSALQLIQSKLN
jgi:hypothetical protein